MTGEGEVDRDRPRVVITPKFKRCLVCGCIAALLLLVCGGVWFVCKVAPVALHAENALHATNRMTVVVRRFVEQEGRWPRSRDDLLAVSAPVPSCFFWQENRAEAERYPRSHSCPAAAPCPALWTRDSGE